MGGGILLVISVRGSFMCIYVLDNFDIDIICTYVCII